MADRRKDIYAEVKCARMAESYRKPGSVSGLHGGVLTDAWNYRRSNIDPDLMSLRRRRSRGGDKTALQRSPVLQCARLSRVFFTNSHAPYLRKRRRPSTGPQLWVVPSPS